MKIVKVNLWNLRNEEHFQLMTDVKGLAGSVGASALGIDPLFAAFVPLLEKEDTAMETIRKHELTDSITEADTQRDSVYRGLTLLVEAYGHSLNEAKREAASRIRAVIDHYGDFRYKSYNEETATIGNFLQDLNSRCAADVALLNGQEWIDELTAANRTFDDLMNRRFDDRAGQEMIRLRETRREVDNIYGQMTDRIEALILLNGEAAFSGFVNRLNERISYFKNTLLQRQKRTAAKKKTEQQQ
ncbi:MAG: DUF6261 family protein [Bacteroidales bacterium]|jgi:hypothetical protein|nr:DUF6261 family protein [Bacteroidales bacterium]